MEYYSLNSYLRELYGEKVYKIAIDGGFTCPNRDGKIGYGGCIFCSGMGSGEFAGNRVDSITSQIEKGKLRVISKMNINDGRKAKFIAYFQSFTGTYGPIWELRSKYMEAISHPDIVGLSIATRPDCLSDEIIELISSINNQMPVWVELGLQTIHEKTADYIRRGYSLSIYDEALLKLNSIGVHVVTHVILGLPYESREMILDSVKYIGNKAISLSSCPEDMHKFGIKLQLLHVLKGTDLEKEYLKGSFELFSIDEYVKLVAECIRVLPEGIVVHRITGDGDKKSLIAPLWSADKKRVLNAIKKEICML